MYNNSAQLYVISSYHNSCSVNANGELEQVKSSNQSRDSMLNVPLEHVYPLYKALRLFDDTLYDPANIIRFKLEEGKYSKTLL